MQKIHLTLTSSGAWGKSIWSKGFSWHKIQVALLCRLTNAYPTLYSWISLFFRMKLWSLAIHREERERENCAFWFDHAFPLEFTFCSAWTMTRVRWRRPEGAHMALGSGSAENRTRLRVILIARGLEGRWRVRAEVSEKDTGSHPRLSILQDGLMSLTWGSRRGQEDVKRT